MRIATGGLLNCFTGDTLINFLRRRKQFAISGDVYLMGILRPYEELYDENESNDPRRGVTILSFGDKFTFFEKGRNTFLQIACQDFR
ncbi:hypothetical protein BDE36_2014 [Arcticibacter tournemirensis]|uniref:hypothetical protein n=1 Tax=Arcticibacter tournemirensis TaxID=699437 RepID=UPI00116FDD1D|nr:hypothetical protein [Arcticibacter tournemirensis]TQM50275.1 hypothetical protein BDE36_2014 [Arcticibacter tournemirensis]